MLIGLLLLAALLTVPLFGGRLLALADLAFDAGWAAVAAIAIQIVIVSVLPGDDPALHRALHLGSYLLAGWFVWRNRRLPGLLLIAAGGASNLIAIAVNHGVMPASPRALRAAGLPLEQPAFLNSTAIRGARLQALGDIIPTPHGFPLPNVYSLGDVLLLAGAVVLLHQVTGTRPARAVARRIGRPRVELVRTAWAADLVRVRLPAGVRATALVLHADGCERRTAPLPAPAGATVGFALPRGGGEIVAVEVGARRIAVTRVG